MLKGAIPLVAMALTSVCVTASSQAPKPAPTHRSATIKATKKKLKVPAATEGIGAARARLIQAALVRAGYLKAVTGYWDAATQLAMKSFQAANHWQQHFVPDSRALIALGLGPVHDDATLVAAAPANH